MVSQRLAKPSYPLDSLSSTLSVGAKYIHASGVTVAYAAPTRLVRVRIFGGVPYIISGGAEVGESGRAVNPLPLAEWVRIPPP